MQHLRSLISLLSLEQIIDSSTRVTPDSESILDLFMVASWDEVLNSGVCDAITISDRLTVYADRASDRERDSLGNVYCFDAVHCSVYS